MDKVILGLQQVIKASVTAQATANSGPLKLIKKVYFGDPIKIPEDDLPAIAIQPISSDYKLRGSRYDEKTHTVEIRLISNKKYFFTTSQSEPEVVGIVRDTTQKSETEDYVGQTIHESIAGIVQNNVCLFYNPGSGAKQVANLLKTTGVSYVFKEDRGFPTYEVIVQIQAIVIGDR